VGLETWDESLGTWDVWDLGRGTRDVRFRAYASALVLTGGERGGGCGVQGPCIFPVLF
jgi:hypothetical protein